MFRIDSEELIGGKNSNKIVINENNNIYLKCIGSLRIDESWSFILGIGDSVLPFEIYRNNVSESSDNRFMSLDLRNLERQPMRLSLTILC